MTTKSKYVFSGLLSLLVILVFVFAFSLSLLLSDTRAADTGYGIVTKTHTNNTIKELNVKVYPNEEKLTSAINKYIDERDNRLRAGFSVWAPDGTQCTIFVVEPKTERDFDSWGHELGHCVYGRWHPTSRH